jgi:hypothetical protein
METTKKFDNLVWSKNAVVIVLNKAEGAQVQNFYGDDAMEFGNALTTEWRGRYPYREQGVYLSCSWEAMEGVIKDDNLGYVLGRQLPDLIKAGRLAYSSEIDKAQGLYRVNKNGLGLFAAFVPYVNFVKGESNKKGWDRNARTLIGNLESLKMATERGINIQLNWYEENENYFIGEKGLKHLYELHLAGDIEAINTIVNEGVQKKQARTLVAKTFFRIEHQGEDGVRPIRERSGFEIVDAEGNVYEAQELIGKVVAPKRGSLQLNSMTITAEKLDGFVKFLMATGCVLTFPDVLANTLEMAETE